MNISPLRKSRQKLKARPDDPELKLDIANALLERYSFGNEDMPPGNKADYEADDEDEDADYEKEVMQTGKPLRAKSTALAPTEHIILFKTPQHIVF